jgi:hypothetical protein
MRLYRLTTIGVLSSVLFLGNPFIIQAATPSPVMQTEEATVDASMPAMMQEAGASEYVLPYPGILPDHPLYFLKRVRDYILDRLIVDPVRHADFHILQADKRLNMGIFLIEKGNAALAEETISKGEKYMDRAVHELLDVKASGKTPPDYLVEKLEKSMSKHIETLNELIQNSEEPQKSGLAGSLDLVTKLQEEAATLRE